MLEPEAQAKLDQFKQRTYTKIAEQIDRHITTFKLQLKELNDDNTHISIKQDKLDERLNKLDAKLDKLILAVLELNKKVVAATPK